MTMQKALVGEEKVPLGFKGAYGGKAMLVKRIV
jgi:hypothetical protein